MPSTSITPPPGEHKVTERLESVEGPINSSEKMSELYKLRDHVYTKRLDRYKWKILTCVEMHGCRKKVNSIPSQVIDADNDGDGARSNDEADPASEPSPNDYDYDIDSFVAGYANDVIDGVWIAKEQSDVTR